MPDLHSLLLAVDELETAAERPAVLLHHVGHDDREGPGLAVEGVDEAALSLLHGFLYEGEYGVDCVILLVEDLGRRCDTFSYFSVQWTERYWTPNR